MTTRPFEVLAVGSPLHDAAALRRALEPSLRALASLGGRATGEAALGGADPLVVLVGTGGTEAEILRLHAARQAAVPGDPLLLVTHPAHNSLPAALEALARLRQEGARGRIVHLPGPDDGPALVRLSPAFDDLRAFRRLHRSRLGPAGAPCDGLVASVPPAEAVRHTWGPETVAVDLDGALDAVGAVAGERATALAATEITPVMNTGQRSVQRRLVQSGWPGQSRIAQECHEMRLRPVRPAGAWTSHSSAAARRYEGFSGRPPPGPIIVKRAGREKD